MRNAELRRKKQNIQVKEYEDEDENEQAEFNM